MTTLTETEMHSLGLPIDEVALARAKRMYAKKMKGHMIFVGLVMVPLIMVMNLLAVLLLVLIRPAILVLSAWAIVFSIIDITHHGLNGWAIVWSILGVVGLGIGFKAVTSK